MCIRPNITCFRIRLEGRRKFIRRDRVYTEFHYIPFNGCDSSDMISLLNRKNPYGDGFRIKTAPRTSSRARIRKKNFVKISFRTVCCSKLSPCQLSFVRFQTKTIELHLVLAFRLVYCDKFGKPKQIVSSCFATFSHRSSFPSASFITDWGILILSAGAFPF